MIRTAALRPLALLVVLASIATATFFVAAGPAAAHTDKTPATGPAQDHPWEDDGCSVVPDVVPGLFQFTHACQHHDGCYGARTSSRLGCDVRFLFDLRMSCYTVWTTPENRPECLRLANIYFLGVRVFGGPAWDDVS